VVTVAQRLTLQFRNPMLEIGEHLKKAGQNGHSTARGDHVNGGESYTLWCTRDAHNIVVGSDYHSRFSADAR